MSRPPPLQLRHLLLLRFFSHSSPPPPAPPLLPIAFPPAVRSLSTPNPSHQIAQSIASDLIKHATAQTNGLDLSQHLSLHFSDVRFNTPLLLDILNLSSPAGRAALDFYRWIVRRRSFTPNDESLSHLVDFFGRRKDFKSVRDLLAEFRPGTKTFRSSVDRLVRAGRPTQAVRFFENMERDYGLKRDRSSLLVLVSALCDGGFGGHAERIVKKVAGDIFPDEEICHVLIRGWCVDGKLDEATRLMGEIVRGGYEIGTPAYNSVLDSVCKICRKKDPLRLREEAEKVLVEMERNGSPRDSATFGILISNLCKIRKTEDAMNLFNRMGEWGCSPDAEIYLVLIRSLFQAARVSEADEMIEQMRSAGFGGALDRKAYYGFIKILCGIERVDHAIRVFRIMKGYGFVPGIKTYDLLMGKMCAHNQVDRANALFKEAVARGVAVSPKVYKVDPRFVKKPKEKKQKKRLTLPEKMARKRRWLKKLRLSFVKKPKKMRRA